MLTDLESRDKSSLIVMSYLSDIAVIRFATILFDLDLKESRLTVPIMTLN